MVGCGVRAWLCVQIMAFGLGTGVQFWVCFRVVFRTKARVLVII